MRLGFISANNYSNPYPVYPIGVSYLITFLEDNFPQCTISLFDFNLDGSYPELEKWIGEGAFDTIAISFRNIDDIDSMSRNSFVGHYDKIMESIRKTTDVKVIGGGPGFSIFPEVLFERLGLDYAIVGEGELSLCKLLRAIDEGKPCDAIEGVITRNSATPRREYVQAANLRMDCKAARYYFDKGGMLNVQTKRGCPFGCVYCTYPIIDGKRVRNLDCGSVIDNIVRMNREMGVDYLFFTDSVFNMDREYNQRLCNGIIESGIKLEWGAYFNPRDLTVNDLKLYKKAGLTHIEWGTDTLADATLLSYNKGFTWKQIREAHKMADSLEIYQAHFMILGGYGETEKTLDETFSRCQELESPLFFPYIGMRIYPGTQLQKVAIEEGLISKDDNLLSQKFYISKDVDSSRIVEKALATGRKWIFPDMENPTLMQKLRDHHCRGPLWEYLRF